MKKDKLKVAIIGCGGIAGWHLSRIKDFPDLEFVGFHDIIPERADAFVEKTKQGKRYDNFIEMYDVAKPDVLYVCVPPAEHGAIELEAAKRGIHMLIQKPISTDLNLATAISAAIDKAGIITSVGFQDRYLDIGDNIREFVDSHEIGLINGAWVGGIPGVLWWRKRSTSGGQIVEQNIHLFDMLRQFIGEPASVYCSAGKGIVKPGPELAGYDVEDYSAANIVFKNGIVANIFTGDYLQGGAHFQCGLTFYAKDATLDYNLRSWVKVMDKDGIKEIKTALDQGMALDRTFIDAVKTGDASKIRSPYADALKTLRFTLACNDSIDTGKVMQL